MVGKWQLQSLILDCNPRYGLSLLPRYGRYDGPAPSPPCGPVPSLWSQISSLEFLLRILLPLCVISKIVKSSDAGVRLPGVKFISAPSYLSQGLIESFFFLFNFLKSLKNTSVVAMDSSFSCLCPSYSCVCDGLFCFSSLMFIQFVHVFPRFQRVTKTRGRGKPG